MDLLILGASARSAAFSALRLGHQPVCADLFGDNDLTASCPSTRIEPVDYPEGLALVAEDLAPMPWLYTGAIENRPDLVERISARHRLLGNPATTLRAVRNPVALAEVVRSVGLVAPEVRLDPAGLAGDGSWLVKPLASGGGRRIRPLLGERSRTTASVYYQQCIEGLSLAALFVGDGSGSTWLGTTRQFVGRARNLFGYRGSLGPWPVAPGIQEQVERLGQAIASHFGLLGLFGIDLIVTDGRVWPIEVNPRYTASVEVLEWASGRSLLADHLRAFSLDWEERRESTQPQNFVAKEIVFAEIPGRWMPITGLPDPTVFPIIADIPQPGATFEVGEPVLTVFARGSSLDDCQRALARITQIWKVKLRLLFRSAKPGC